MKKIILSGILSIFGMQLSLAQDSAYLDIGNVKALVYSDATLFQDKNTFEAAYEVPKNSNSHTIYSSTFWMSSVDGTRNGKRVIANAYELFGFDNIFSVGPVDIVNQQSEDSSIFQRVWKIDQTEIDDHKKNWNSLNYIVPKSIDAWPGNGTTNTAVNLAPYEDLDNDSIYEPQDGEYPIILGDQAIFLMVNDYRKEDSIVFQTRNGDTTLAYIKPLKVEMHLMLYAYDTTYQPVANAVFVNAKIFNRSNVAADDHTDFEFSVSTDFDIGAGIDDYIGTDTTNNMFYGYNGDLFDESFGGQGGYEKKLAAQGVQFLSHGLSRSLSYGAGPTINGSADNASDVAYYQRSKWRDGSPVYYGGNGFNTTCTDTTTQTQFMFSGDPTMPNDTNQWTEANPCLSSKPSNNNGGDRRILGNPDVPKSLNHGESVVIDYAYVFARLPDTAKNIGDPVGLLALEANSVQEFYDDNILVSVPDLVSKAEGFSFEIYPNPTTGIVQINVKEINFGIELISLEGKKVKEWSNSKTIHLDDINKGVYFLRLRTNDQFEVKKLIVE